MLWCVHPVCATHYSVKGARARPVVTPAAACSHEADRIDIHCLPGIYPSSRVLQILRLQYLRRCLQAGDIKLTKFLTITYEYFFCRSVSQFQLQSRLYWKRVIAQYRGWIVVFQICTMYTGFLDKEIFHQSPGRRLRWHWLHPLRCLCCSWCCAADLVLLCTKLRSCSSRQHSHTTDKYADQNRTLT